VTGAAIVPPTVITGNAEAFIGTDQQTTELQALPLIADDLAKKSVSLIAERW